MAESCGECGAPFASPADLVKHTKSAHRTPETVPAPPNPEADPTTATEVLHCAFCGAGFPNGQSLAAHNRAQHLAPEASAATA